MPIIDKTGLTIGILAGAPQDAEWLLLHLQACSVMADLQPKCIPRKGKCRIHRRGAFIALQCGISHGSGQVHPKNLVNTLSDAVVLNELNSHPFFKCVAGFATSKLLNISQPQLTLMHTCRGDGYLGTKTLRVLREEDWPTLATRSLSDARISKQCFLLHHLQPRATHSLL